MDIMSTMNSNLKDIHSHILSGIDDGSESAAESIKILKLAIQEGVSDIILTPHYIYGSNYACNNKDKRIRFEVLQELVETRNLPIRLYLGNEILLCEHILELLENGECMTLNHSRYVLVELPMNNELLNAKKIFFELVSHEYIPILAHPERYHYISEDSTFFEDLVDMGVLLQGNYKSLLGKYSKGAERRLKKLLQKNMITFLASDTHHAEAHDLKKAYKKTLKIIKDKERVKKLFVENFDYILYDKDVC